MKIKYLLLKKQVRRVWGAPPTWGSRLEPILVKPTHMYKDGIEWTILINLI